MRVRGERHTVPVHEAPLRYVREVRMSLLWGANVPNRGAQTPLRSFRVRGSPCAECFAPFVRSS